MGVVSTWPAVVVDAQPLENATVVHPLSATARAAPARLARDVGKREAPYFTPRSSTSNTSVEFGGMTGGNPRAP